MKWHGLPVILLMMGSLSMTQSQTLAAQSSSPADNATTSTTTDQTAGQGVANGARNGQLALSGASDLESADPVIYGEGAANGGMLATVGIHRAIDDLSRAFASRDLGAVRQLWPSIPKRPNAALKSSFNSFKSVSRNFRPENIAVNGDTATVSGSYSGSFINNATTIPSSGRFDATLQRVGTRWIVVTLVCN